MRLGTLKRGAIKLDTIEDILQQVNDIADLEGRDLRQWLYREILLNALKFKRDELDILDLKVINRMVDEFRYAARVFKPYRKTRKVSIFGSARTPEDEPYYKLASDLGSHMADAGFMAITGAASGIMKAGIDGAGPENSFGVSILLPFESPSVVMEDDPKSITFRFFFTRKIFFVMEADACALFPGGFRTQDEGFEVLTLLQTGKVQPMPLVLMELPVTTTGRLGIGTCATSCCLGISSPRKTCLSIRSSTPRRKRPRGSSHITPPTIPSGRSTATW